MKTWERKLTFLIALAAFVLLPVKGVRAEATVRRFTVNNMMYQETSISGKGKMTYTLTALGRNQAGDLAVFEGKESCKMSYVGACGDTLFFNLKDSGSLNVMSYTIGTEGFRLFARGVNLDFSLKRGRYIIGVYRYSEAPQPDYCCIFNLSTSRAIDLGQIYSPRLYGNLLYYAKASAQGKENKLQIVQSKADGSGKRVLLSLNLPGEIYQVTVCNDHVSYQLKDQGGKVYTVTY